MIVDFCFGAPSGRDDDYNLDEGSHSNWPAWSSTSPNSVVVNYAEPSWSNPSPSMSLADYARAMRAQKANRDVSDVKVSSVDEAVQHVQGLEIGEEVVLHFYGDTTSAPAFLREMRDYLRQKRNRPHHQYNINLYNESTEVMLFLFPEAILPNEEKEGETASSHKKR